MSLFQSGPNNANGYRIYSLIGIAAFIIGIFIPAIFNHHVYNTGFFVAETALFGLTIANVGVGFTAVPNDDAWKSFFLFFADAANLVVPAIFMAVSNNG